ncbi:LytTR family DNA-binding domain-containing protein [Subsaxibacter sp. CAU 1640]|uniref:LytR/AlgR family response regulator transcription factor n=1 Tax=Subsaxibacter sp. CAU 1640 TaxID=2933271 RepID=UPI002002E3E4|nr:LytTR family DNA-binding domain-containing protein [Subsaxibacter sp. CAU 1640]MCK7590551.1 LytTR family DNA-binding domain-containing protein [Subsaxibacter sp. CAU 1640]
MYLSHNMMKILKALIVEDNAFMANALLDMLQSHTENISVLGIAHSGNEALKMISKTQPNVVFLDIELPDMTGFELLNQLPEITFKTIFTTAHSHYAIKAFRFNALDYLVKPIKEHELNEAIKRCLKSTDNSTEIQIALTNLETKNVSDQKLILPTQTGTLRFSLKQITLIESERNYSYIHLTNNTKELSSKNLAYFEDILEDKSFFRCHRSFLVNKFFVTELKEDFFILKSGVKIPISRRKKRDAKDWLLNQKNHES